ncbi:hypothetical protein SAY86_019964 [Trapa natans]|uniref:peroxidase n=1 Tax=Trapa natans TaxID=22666 RepID=A0AAN7R557_TRANT|nr:hypothetical protein SAY86_019964 [Trapa natans]
MQACDASILLDDTATFTGEKTALPNVNSVRGYEVIDAINSAHTIGQSRCFLFRTRIYNETNINPTLAPSRQQTWAGGDDNLAPLDFLTRNVFDNIYFTNLVNQRGLLHSDQQLFSNGSTDAQVIAYVPNPASFMVDFARAMVKLGNLGVLTCSNGHMRANYTRVNGS